MFINTGPSPAAIRRATARRAVGAHLNVQWTDATIAPSDTECSGRIEAAKAALSSLSYPGKPQASGSLSYPNGTKPPENATPSLIFFYSTAAKRRPTDCDAAWQELFLKESDFSVFIPGRFFTVLRVDVTRIKQSAKNRYICSENAPVVVLTRANGEIEEVLEGSASIKSLAVARTMCNILRKDGFLKKPSTIPDLNGLMVSLQRAEESLLVDKEDLEKIKGKLTEVKGRASRKITIAASSSKDKPSSSVDAAQKSVENVEKKLKDKQTEKYNILTKEYAMLQELGLPTSKMPPEPVEP